jgi:hypothetical protein
MPLLLSFDPASISLSLQQRIQQIPHLRTALKDIEVVAVEVEEVAKVAVAVAVEEVIIVIRRIKVVEVFKEEDMEDIDPGAGPVYIDRNQLDQAVVIDTYTHQIHFETPFQGSVAFVLRLATYRTIVTNLRNRHFINLKILGRVITILRRKDHI